MQVRIDTKVGTMYLAATSKGVQWLHWKKSDEDLSELNGHGPEVQILKIAKQQLEEFFEGKRREFDLPLDPRGTDFQKKFGESSKISLMEKLVRIKMWH